MISFLEPTKKYFKYPVSVSVETTDMYIWSNLLNDLKFQKYDQEALSEYQYKLLNPSTIGYKYRIVLIHPTREYESFSAYLIDPLVYINRINADKYSGMIMKYAAEGFEPVIHHFTELYKKTYKDFLFPSKKV
jgi:hypothetical protein